MLRLCQVKNWLIQFSQWTWTLQSEFVNLQDILVDLKKTPDCLEIPVPRFFKEVERKRLDERDQLVTTLMKDLAPHGDSPEVEVYASLVPVIQDLETAIRIIQMNERGRIGIKIAQKTEYSRQEKIKKRRREK